MELDPLRIDGQSIAWENGRWREIFAPREPGTIDSFSSGRLLWSLPASEFAAFLSALAEHCRADAEISLTAPHIGSLDNNLGRGVFLSREFFARDPHWNSLFAAIDVEEFFSPVAARAAAAAQMTPPAAARLLRGTVECFRVTARRRAAAEMVEPPAAGADESKKKRPRLAIVCQPEYFRFIYENDLNDLFEFGDFQMRWGEWSRDYDRLIAFRPDVTLFFRPEVYPDRLLNAVGGVKVAISSEPIPKHVDGRFVTSADMEARFSSLLGARGRYDRFYHFDRTSLQFLRENGFHVDGEFTFPVALGTYRPLACKPTWDVGFFGRDTAHRDRFLALLKRDLNTLHIAHGVHGRDLVELINRCRMVVNLHVDEHTNFEPRMQLQMACGVMVLSEPLSHDDCMRPGEHFCEFRSVSELHEKVRHYLARPDERRSLAAAGLAFVRERLDSRRVLPAFVDCMMRGESWVETREPKAAAREPAAALQGAF